uniref:Uncharacterized protein n=1 Tax=Anguilla anguilla TaxID=7936 RepID=A0A0E9WV97_ANGAN
MLSVTSPSERIQNHLCSLYFDISQLYKILRHTTPDLVNMNANKPNNTSCGLRAAFWC